MDNPSHSVLYLNTGTFPQNEVGILLKWWRHGTGKPHNFEKNIYRDREREREREREKGFCNVVHDFSFLKRP